MRDSHFPPPPLIVALDFARPREALRLAGQLDPGRCRLKVGKELFTRGGPRLVERLVGSGFELFLDLKYHDIPNTVAGACAAAADLGVWMVNVHALGGRRMMEAARDAIESQAHRPLLVAVTVLTSMDQSAMREVGLSGTPQEAVGRLAGLAREAGMDGVVCSAHEASVLRSLYGREFCLVTPGVRPAAAERGDQKRVMTPGAARRAGADYLVVGRPVAAAPEPLRELAAIEAELAA